MDSSLDFTKVSRVAQCEELALTDAYGGDEEVMRWYTCLSEVLGVIKDVEVLEERASYKGLLVQEDQILMKVQRNKKTALVSLGSVSFFGAPTYVRT